jgi:hypothetical protein
MYDSAGKECLSVNSDLSEILARIKDSNQEFGVLYYEVVNAPQLQPLLSALSNMGLAAEPVRDDVKLILVSGCTRTPTKYPLLRIEWSPEQVKNWWPNQKFVPATSLLVKLRLGSIFAFLVFIFASLLCALFLDRYSLASQDLVICAIGSLILLCLLGLLENEPANQSN